MSAAAVESASSSSAAPEASAPAYSFEKLTVFLPVNNCKAALEWYQVALGAKEAFVFPAEDGRIMHAMMKLGEQSFVLHDEFPEGNMWSLSPTTVGEASLRMSIQVAEVSQVGALIDRAVQHGAKVLVPAADQFWQDHYGAIVDPYGHHWGIGATLCKPEAAAEPGEKKGDDA